MTSSEEVRSQLPCLGGWWEAIHTPDSTTIRIRPVIDPTFRRRVDLGLSGPALKLIDCQAAADTAHSLLVTINISP